jgi:NADPH:quinone reductase-like Zn-dependent oxidoreductase
MKAAVYTSYGPPDVVQIQDVAQPVPRDHEVLLAVRATAVNPLDGVIKGRPYLARLMTGLRTPHVTRLGVDVAGQVEAVGRHVTQFKPGDAVFGACLRDPHASGVTVWV